MASVMTPRLISMMVRRFRLVGDMTAIQGQGQLWQVARQPDQAEAQGAVGQVVDLPAQPHQQHLLREGGGHLANPEAHEGRVSEQGGGGHQLSISGPKGALF